MFRKRRGGANRPQLAKQCNILVADDDDRIQSIYRGLFSQGKGVLGVDAPLLQDQEEMPWSVTIVDQGEKAVHAVEEREEQGEHFACALLDLQMPPGIDGVETAKRIHELDPNIFLTIVATYADRVPEEVGRLLKGNFTIVRKPFYGDQLVQLVRKYIQLRNNQYNYLHRFV